MGMGRHISTTEEHDLYDLNFKESTYKDKQAKLALLQENLTTVKDAIEKSGGWLTKAASMLGCNVVNLTRIIAKNPELMELYNDIKEKYLDIAEIKLLQLVKKGELDAIKFWLTSQGKKRGWGVKDEGVKGGGNTIIFNIEPAFNSEDVKKQAEERIKEIEAKEYIEVQANEVTTTVVTETKEEVETLVTEIKEEIKSNLTIDNEKCWDQMN